MFVHIFKTICLKNINLDIKNSRSIIKKSSYTFFSVSNKSNLNWSEYLKTVKLELLKTTWCSITDKVNIRKSVFSFYLIFVSNVRHGLFWCLKTNKAWRRKLMFFSHITFTSLDDENIRNLKLFW